MAVDRTERFYRILSLLNARRRVTRAEFLAELEISAATFKRDLEYLRDRLQAPIVWDAAVGGYRLESDAGRAQLPGLWLSPGELRAMAVAERVIRALEPGLLATTLAPLRGQIDRLLADAGERPRELEGRLKIVAVGAREPAPGVLEALLAALSGRRRVKLRHHVRARDEVVTRTVSPQRFVRYRDNWYLDAWCHTRQALRTFAADSILEAELTIGPVHEMRADDLDDEVEHGFGIFAGSEVRWARLEFTPERALWVSRERWHPQQKGGFGAGGEYLLEVPYTVDHELVMEILKYGADCVVLAPESLRSRVAEAGRALAARYAAPASTSAPGADEA